MNATLLAQAILFALIWFGTWAFFFLYMVPRGITYLEYYEITSLYFLAIAMSILLLFAKEFTPFVAGAPPLDAMLAFTGFSVMSIVLYYAVPRAFHRPSQFIARNHAAYFLLLDTRYLISKTSDIIYQQIFIILVIGALHRLGIAMDEITAIFAIFFGIIHIPLMLFDGVWWGLYFIVAAFCASVLFPPLILHIPYGFIYSFMLHWAFYIFSGVFPWIILSKK